MGIEIVLHEYRHAKERPELISARKRLVDLVRALERSRVDDGNSTEPTFPVISLDTIEMGLDNDMTGRTARTEGLLNVRDGRFHDRDFFRSRRLAAHE